MSIADELPWYDGVPGVVECGEGWHELIRRLHDRVVGIDPGYKVTQVKEKFGGLAFYVFLSEGLDDLLRERVYHVMSEAEEESFRTCEVCGKPGQLNNGPWYRTLCEIHQRLSSA